jgi:hypothetical protein
MASEQRAMMFKEGSALPSSAARSLIRGQSLFIGPPTVLATLALQITKQKWIMTVRPRSGRQLMRQGRRRSADQRDGSATVSRNWGDGG